MDYHSSATLGELKCYQACALSGIFTTANSVRKMFDSEGMEIAQARAILGDDVFLPVGVEFDVSFHSITCYTFFLSTRVPGILKCARQLGIVNLQWFIAPMWPSSMAKQLKLWEGCFAAQARLMIDKCSKGCALSSGII